MAYEYKRFPYVPAPGLSEPEPVRSVVVVGAGPVGLALALDLASHGVAVTLLDDNDVVSVGSRAICWSKRSLEILDRLGVGAKCVEKGVTWKIGRTFHRDREVYRFDLLPEDGHKMPAFVNLQQYYVEEYLAEAALAHPLVDLRFRNRVTGLKNGAPAVLEIETPDGAYELKADWVAACDGAKSSIRDMLGLAFEGELFEERFLIADVEVEADFPAERRFWFEPTFHSGQSALLHKQPDNIYRIDLQLGWDADPEVERRPEQVVPRIEKVLGHRKFRLDWVSVYTFQYRRLARFVHGRVIFAGDSAHLVSPFGARGGNGGLQDVDALGWRLAAIVKGGDPAMLGAYDRERCFAADENIRHSSRATRFLTPDEGAERLFRDGVLSLAAKAPFARGWVNSGRLSTPCVYPSGNAPDHTALPEASRPGAVAPDAPQPDGWLIDRIGREPVILGVGQRPPDVAGARVLEAEPNAHVRDRYLGTAQSAIYLVRPDQVIAARWLEADKDAVAEQIGRIWEGT